MKKFAISDIHGCRKSFLALLDKIALSKADTLYLLGDYVDRGPDSKGVLDAIFDLLKDGYPVRCLRGNHEAILLRSLYDLTGLDNWLQTDGKKTLDSFAVEATHQIPESYLEFLREMDYFIETDGYILVHAGLNFKLFDPLEDQRDLLVIRHWYGDIRYDWLGERIILHGHTPLARMGIEQQLNELAEKQYLDLDGGCVYAGSERPERAGQGVLCAFDMTDRRLYFQENIE
ncbi:MAG: serine/threonine protein phosphatase [Saprospiraceae bacterium]|nr:serine/threonine protein phosphatase [Saprospiraceae bacterium]